MNKPREVVNLTCDDIKALLAAHAVGDAPLDAPTRAHMLQCPDCRQALREYSGIVRLLPYDAPEVAPPAQLRDRLVAAVARETQPTPPVVPARPTEVIRPERSRPVVVRLWSALAGALVVIVALIGWNISLQQQVATQAATLDASRNGWRVLVTMMNDPEVRSFKVAGTSGHGTIWAAPHGQVACLMLEDMPAAPAGQIFQVWLKSGQSWVSAGTFDGRAGNRWMMMQPGDQLGRYSAVLVTAEPDGGSDTPTGIQLVQGLMGSKQD